MKKLTYLFLIAFTALQFGCRTTSKVQSKWRNDDYKNKKYNSIAILAAMKSVPDNASFEKKVTQRINEININAIPGYDILSPGDTSYTQEEIKLALAKKEAEAVIVFKLIGVQKDKTYNPPSTYGAGYYGPYYGYYNHWYPAYRVNQTDGYWSETNYFIIETNIYDVADEELIWSAKTSTADPKNFTDLGNSVINEVIKVIQKEKRQDAKKK